MIELIIIGVVIIVLLVLTCPLVIDAIFKKIKKDEKDKHNKPRIGWPK